MRVLIIGGTRFMGPRVIDRLVDADHEVAAFHRGPGAGSVTRSIVHIHGDRHRLPDHAGPLRAFGPDAVIDMMLLTEANARDLLAVFSGHTEHIIAVSSCDVYRNYGRLIGAEPSEPDPAPLTEDSPLRERLYPYRTEEPQPDGAARPWTQDYDKILVERTLQSQAEVPVTVLRLPMVHGPNDGQHRLFPYLKRVDDGRPFILLSEAQAAWKTARGYADNVAAGIALAATDERSRSRTYNVADPEPFTEADWVRTIAGATGWTGRVITLPPDRMPAHLKDEADFRQHLAVDSTRIRHELGYDEPVPFDEALKSTIEWERANPPQNINPDEYDYAAEDEAALYNAFTEVGQDSGSDVEFAASTQAEVIENP